MKNKIYWLSPMGIHIPKNSTYHILKQAHMLGFWFFADEVCTKKEFERLIPLMLAYCHFVIGA